MRFIVEFQYAPLQARQQAKVTTEIRVQHYLGIIEEMERNMKRDSDPRIWRKKLSVKQLFVKPSKSKVEYRWFMVINGGLPVTQKSIIRDGVGSYDGELASETLQRQY